MSEWLQSGVSVLILHQEVREESLLSDAGVLDEVAAVREALQSSGIPSRVVPVSRLEDVARAVSSGPEPVVFNLVEGFSFRPEDFAYVPAVCRSLGRACTGSDADCIGLTLNKARTSAA